GPPSNFSVDELTGRAGSVRTTRARIIHLRNDYKDLMALIEKRLHEHFASLEDSEDEQGEHGAPSPGSGQREAAGTAILRDSVSERLPEPFARVNSVAPGGPAALAGLTAGDEVRSFGYVDRSNHDDLRRV